MSFITLDYETSFSSGKINPEKFSLTDMTYEEYIKDPRFFAYGVGIKIDDQPTYWVKGIEDVAAEIKKLFPPGNNHTLLAHNAMFDAAVLVWHHGCYANRYICTQMMSRALWRFQSASLANLAKRIWPKNPKMRKGKELAVADGLLDINQYTPEIYAYVGGYCIQDCDLTFEAFKAMYPSFPDDELEVIDDVTKMFAHRPLALDHDLVRQYQEEIHSKRQLAFSKSGYPKEVLGSSKQFVEAIKRDYDIEIKQIPSPTLKNPKNMKYPLAKNDLEFILLQRDRPDLQHVWDGRIAAASNQEHTRCERFLSHAEVGPWNPEGRIGIPLVYCGAGTTRFSGTNSVNMQNLGRKSKLRNAIRAPEGRKLIISDLSNIEGRMNAYHARAYWKLEKYANGDDLYNDLATDIFGKPIDRKQPGMEEEGNVGKVGELGLGYGMGAPKFLTTCQTGPMGMPPMLWMTMELAERTTNAWRTKNREIADSWYKADEMLELMSNPSIKPFMWNTVEIGYQYIKLPSGLTMQYPQLKFDVSAFANPDGSPRWSWMYWNGKYWKDLWGGVIIENIIQGISRVVMTEAEVRIKREFEQRRIDAMLCMQIHDELIFVTPEKDVEVSKEIIYTEMRRRPTWCDESLELDASCAVSDFYMK